MGDYNKLFPVWDRFKATSRFLLIRFMNILLQIFMFLIQILIFIPMVLKVSFFMEYMKILPKTFHKNQPTDEKHK